MRNLLPIVLVGIISAVAAIGLYKLLGKDTTTVIYQTENGGFTTAALTENTNTSSNVAFDFTEAAEKGLPAAVHIRSVVPGRNRGNSLDDFFNFRRRDDGEAPPSQGFGSGVIIHPDGYITTNNHVIEEATEINVALSDNNVYKAELIGTDPTTDIALIKIDAERPLEYLRFADSDDVKIGQWVAAIGNPAVGSDAYTLKSTVTAGIVSAKGRNIRINGGGYAIEAFIQTDAVINKGNSGGALVDANGNLVGINTAITTPTGVYAGYGFAVPSNLVKKVVTDLKDFGEVRRALLGINFVDIEQFKSENPGQELDTKEKEGIFVSGVRPGGAADKAGMKDGDVIVELDGKSVVNGEYSVQEIIGVKRPGETVDVVYKRDGSTKRVTVPLISIEDTDENYAKIANVQDISELGIEVEQISDEELEELELENGVRIREVERESMLYENFGRDIRPGFIILRVNDKKVTTSNAVKNAINSSNSDLVKIDGYDPFRERYQSFTFQYR